jgi:serine/threonine protein kinase
MVAADSVDAVPRAWILDLGLGCMIEGRDEAGDLTAAGHTVGTLDYIAPEQLEDGRAADIRSDIYSLGCTIFQTLTGRLPYEGSNLGDMLLAKLTTDAPLVNALRTDVPKQLAAVVARLICRERDKRPAVPAEVAEAFLPFSMVSRLKSAAHAEVSGVDAKCFEGVERGERIAECDAVQGQPRRLAGAWENKAAWLSQFWSRLSPNRLLSRWTSKDGAIHLHKSDKSLNSTARLDDRGTGR